MEMPTGAKAKNKKARKFGPLIILLLVIIIGGYFIWAHYHEKNKTFVVSTPQQVEDSSKKFYDSLKDNKDYKSYQQTQTSLASLYISNNDLVAADKVMSQLFSDVPSDQITSTTYGTMVELERGKKDTAQYKHYMELYISQLKKEGKSTAAEQQQKVLDSGV